MACTLDKTGDVHELNTCGNSLLGLAEGRQNLQPRVWHSHHADIGLYRAEREVRGLRFTILHLPHHFQLLAKELKMPQFHSCDNNFQTSNSMESNYSSEEIRSREQGGVSATKTAYQSIEQSRFSDIRKADNAALQSHAHPPAREPPPHRHRQNPLSHVRRRNAA